MDLSEVNAVADQKLDIEPIKPICRCCLSTERRMFETKSIESKLIELTGINMECMDSLPLRICYECIIYLHKAVRFKNRVLNAHNILYEYVTRCTPFPIEAQDPELSKYASPILRATEVLTCTTNGRGRLGFLKVLVHKKKISGSMLDKPVENDPIPVPPPTFKVEVVKEENGFSDFDDNIALEDIRTIANQSHEEDSNQEKIETDVKSEEKKETSKRKRKDTKQEPAKKRKKVSTSDNEAAPEPKKSIRRSLELDPSKIRVIKLNPEEQIRMREEESKASLKFPYQCSLCFKGFNFESKLLNHMQKHNPSRGPYECKLCKMYLPNPYSYGVHRLIHTQRYECVKCKIRMIDKLSILDHYRSKHEGVTSYFSCHICGKISTNNKTHRGHMRNHHAGVGRPKCDQCGKTFVNKDSLDDHLLIHAGVKNYECAVCGARFRTRSQIKLHQLSHTEERNFYCVECDVRFKTAQSLRQHLKKSVKHVEIETLKFSCRQCEKRFATEQALMHHTLIQHEGFRGHRCGECGAALASAASLAKHVTSVHKGWRPKPRHVCDSCGKAFTSKSTLMNHVRTHTGEKPFECDICGRKFAQRTAMKTHVKFIHLKIRRRNKIKPEVTQVPGSKMEQMFAKEEPPPAYDAWREQTNCDAFYHITNT